MNKANKKWVIILSNDLAPNIDIPVFYCPCPLFFEIHIFFFLFTYFFIFCYFYLWMNPINKVNQPKVRIKIIFLIHLFSLFT